MKNKNRHRNIETEKSRKKYFKEYEKLPEWIQTWLGYSHHHIVINNYHAPKDRDSDEYDEWFDKNQQLMYTEQTVVILVQALLNGHTIEVEDGGKHYVLKNKD